MKKNIILFITLAIVFSGTALRAQKQAELPPKIKWITYKEATEKNKGVEKRKILTDVFTAWCGWCTRMDATTFADADVVDYVNKYFWAVKLDAEMKEPVVIDSVTYVNQRPNANRSTHELAFKLLQGQLSYPSYVISNEENQIITIVPGYFNKENFMIILRYFNENIYLTKPFAQYKAESAQVPIK